MVDQRFLSISFVVRSIIVPLGKDLLVNFVLWPRQREHPPIDVDTREVRNLHLHKTKKSGISLKPVSWKEGRGRQTRTQGPRSLAPVENKLTKLGRCDI